MGNKTIKVYANIDEGYLSFSNMTDRQEEWLRKAEKDLKKNELLLVAINILSSKFPNDSDLGKEVRKMINKDGK